ncbi:CLUMA_CG009654, isoform A [Clunio marinus]|uniref:CLUMA_CG009654, isoform A n=1 Tax=Clunio marinus TaxID=568069 RepID=A0A1J1I7R2_9DIPT|nr:CLUMA_CG009654, isoform A [Clunio marinus]
MIKSKGIGHGGQFKLERFLGRLREVLRDGDFDFEVDLLTLIFFEKPGSGSVGSHNSISLKALVH